MNQHFLTTNLLLWRRKRGRHEFSLWLDPKVMLGIDFGRYEHATCVLVCVGCFTFEWMLHEEDAWKSYGTPRRDHEKESEVIDDVLRALADVPAVARVHVVEEDDHPVYVITINGWSPGISYAIAKRLAGMGVYWGVVMAEPNSGEAQS